MEACCLGRDQRVFSQNNPSPSIPPGWGFFFRVFFSDHPCEANGGHVRVRDISICITVYMLLACLDFFVVMFFVLFFFRVSSFFCFCFSLKGRLSLVSGTRCWGWFYLAAVPGMVEALRIVLSCIALGLMYAMNNPAQCRGFAHLLLLVLVCTVGGCGRPAPPLLDLILSNVFCSYARYRLNGLVIRVFVFCHPYPLYCFVFQGFVRNVHTI